MGKNTWKRKKSKVKESKTQESRGGEKKKKTKNRYRRGTWGRSFDFAFLIPIVIRESASFLLLSCN